MGQLKLKQYCMTRKKKLSLLSAAQVLSNILVANSSTMLIPQIKLSLQGAKSTTQPVEAVV